MQKPRGQGPCWQSDKAHQATAYKLKTLQTTRELGERCCSSKSYVYTLPVLCLWGVPLGCTGLSVGLQSPLIRVTYCRYTLPGQPQSSL